MRRSTNIVAEITSKLIVEEAKFCDIQEKRGTARGFSLSHLGVGSTSMVEGGQEKSAFWIQNFGMHVLVPLFLYQLLEAESCTFHKVTVNRSMQIAEALQMQMEVQKKLYKQIEVQRHLQLKIEAQGKYLQSGLHKAQETLAGMINNGSPGSPPISELIETRGGFSWSCGQRKQNRGTMCSLEI
ncbi:uncharacterized protein LOC107493224 [Arachis duranensis]|uniref:Uncharacterized protein LOC107493224 n=1 Tax=Arachis duranensis TaxID=130453 RepID=A0A6P4DNQ2_ARADU|nr:uncharacterized protein LOC107493224 [Arachis duranensis]